MTLDNINMRMRINMMGCRYDGYNEGIDKFDSFCGDGKGVGWVSPLYFATLIILGAMVLISLLVGVIITSMELLREDAIETAKVWANVALVSDAFHITDEKIGLLLKLFELVDDNSNCKITFPEFQTLMYAITIPEKDQQEIFVHVDRDGSGHIDFAEFAELVCIIGFSVTKKAKDTAKHMIEEMDRSASNARGSVKRGSDKRNSDKRADNSRNSSESRTSFRDNYFPAGATCKTPQPDSPGGDYDMIKNYDFKVDNELSIVREVSQESMRSGPPSYCVTVGAEGHIQLSQDAPGESARGLSSSQVMILDYENGTSDTESPGRSINISRRSILDAIRDTPSSLLNHNPHPPEHQHSKEIIGPEVQMASIHRDDYGSNGSCIISNDKSGESVGSDKSGERLTSHKKAFGSSDNVSGGSSTNLTSKVSDAVQSFVSFTYSGGRISRTNTSKSHVTKVHSFDARSFDVNDHIDRNLDHSPYCNLEQIEDV